VKVSIAALKNEEMLVKKGLVQFHHFNATVTFDRQSGINPASNG
jgi:hypothetical protein